MQGAGHVLTASPARTHTVALMEPIPAAALRLSSNLPFDRTAGASGRVRIGPFAVCPRPLSGMTLAVGLRGGEGKDGKTQDVV